MFLLDEAQAATDGGNNSHRVLLIDLENCPGQIHQLMNNLEHYAQVLICYAQCGVKVPIDWIVPLTATVNANKLKLLKMPLSGKNAADFGITFWAGVLMAELPLDTHFDIVSNDADLDYVVSLLISQQRSAKRIGIKKELPEPVLALPKRNYLQEYCAHINKHSKPAKKATLLNSINSKFKPESINSEELFLELVKQGVIVVTDNRITYNRQKIADFAGH
jgi:hypothetical protein